jgi:hypothetical protein
MKYTTIFSSLVKPLVSEEKDKYLAMASLVDVGEFIPEIDTKKNVDLLPVAFNACVVNRANKNGDVIDTETALDIYKSFINKPINIEHNRNRVIGTILTAGFSEFGTDKPLSEEEVKETKEPFNITLGGIVWKIVNDRLADIIEEASDPTSEQYLKVSASWELGFADYNIIVTEGNQKNIENSEVISDNEKIEELSEFLKGFGGDGKLKNGKNIYRQVIGDVVPLGIGLTESPAADVEGIAVKETTKLKIEKEKEKEGISTESPVKEKLKTEQNISQNNENNVTHNKDINMKITSLKDITNESLQELSASAVTDFIEEQIKEVSEKFSTDKKEAEEVITNSKENLNKLSEELESVKAEMEKLQQEKTEREALELFNQRMVEIDEEYELDDDIRAAITSEIKNMDNDTYAAYRKRMANYMKKNKKSFMAEKAKAQEEALEKAREEGKIQAEEIKANQNKPTETSEENLENVVEEALEKAEKEEEQVPVTSEASDSSVYDKYKEAFSLENFDIKL